MNPEENNPLTNPGVPAPGADLTNNPSGSFGSNGGYASSDMGASFSVQGASANGLGGIGEVVNNGFESTDTTLDTSATDSSAVTDEPLVPAAPVPGSIGSAISAPPAAPAPAAPVAAPTFGANASTTMGTGPMPAPAVAPQATSGNGLETAPQTASAPAASTPGFTPFTTASTTAQSPSSAAPSTASSASTTPSSATAAAPAPGGINPAFQPAAKIKKSKKMNFELGSKSTSIILLVLAGLFMVATVVMAVLYFQAANKKPQIVYTPSPDQNQTTSHEVLKCSGQDDFGYLVGGAGVVGTKGLTASYINGDLGGLTATFSIPFADEGAAIAGMDALIAEQSALLANVNESFVSNYWVNGNTVEAYISTKAGFDNGAAAMFLYGLTDKDTSTSLENLQEKYESEGLVCEVE